ncbi:MAG: nucleoside-triphosphatase [Spirochaetales bacterium]|jgi:nucleoside-triphosphatase THEP1
MRQLMMITGPIRSGKTAFCRTLFSILKQESLSPFSIIEENTRDAAGIPISLALRDQGTGETIALGSRGEEGLALPGRPYAAFAFSQEAFRWADARIKAAVARGCGPVLIDEIGPLEANEKGGFFETLLWVMENGTYPLLVTIRPELTKAFEARLPPSVRDGVAGIFPLEATSINRMLGTMSNDAFRHCQD